MKKKFFASAMAAAMVASSMSGIAAFADEVDYGSGEITIWVADKATELTQQLAEDWLKENNIDYTVTVESVGEGDAANNMITDVEGGADIYAFAQDQLSRLVAANALQPLTDTGYDEWIEEQNDEGAVEATTFGSTIYAFPMTSDNGYFMYYDSSVITDPTSLEKIVEDCEKAGKNFYYEINSGWYQTSFFFGTGCTLEYTTNDAGEYVTCATDYASEQGIVALREIIELASSKAFQNGSSLSSATDVAAIVDGTWDSDSAKELFGDNFACAKLPSFEGSDGKEYQLGGFCGYKMMGVKPQTEAGKIRVCLELAKYLTSTDCQLERYEQFGWGPSNLDAQENKDVKADVALTALRDQMEYSEKQGQYPDDYWSRATSLGDDVISKNITADMSDDDLMKILTQFEDDCVSYAQERAEVTHEEESSEEASEEESSEEESSEEASSEAPTK